MIDSKLAINGGIENYYEKVVGFSQKEGVDLVEGFDLVDRFFKVYGKETHVYTLLKALYGLFFSLQHWYFKMDVICAYF